MGTPDFSVPVLEEIVSKHEVIAVFTQPDRKRGRGHALQFSPVKEKALALDIPVFTDSPTEHVSLIEKADLAIVVAYGKLLKEEVLSAPKYGCVNLHASLLPKYRGASPMQAAILASEKYSGVSAMLMDQGLDTGDILYQESLNIQGMNIEVLHDELSKMSAQMVPKIIDSIGELLSNRTKQDEALATMTYKIQKKDAELDFHLPAVELVQRVLAFSPFPGAYTTINGVHHKILKASFSNEEAKAFNIYRIDENGIYIGTVRGCLVIEEIQKSGKKAMKVSEYLRGNKLDKNTKIGG